MVSVNNFGIKIGKFAQGEKNSITDVKGIRVGHAHIHEAEIHTGVTVILPRENIWQNKVPAGSFVMNGNGEATGLMWIQESGIIETPIAFTNTLSLGQVVTALVQYQLDNVPESGIDDDTFSPVVLECDDSTLNDIRGLHIEREHVVSALRNASTDAVLQGAVGAGAGMISYQFKGGIGSSSRRVQIGSEVYTVGIILNSNHGKRHTLTINGKKMGEKFTTPVPGRYKDGSIVICVATDAPLDSRQLNRLAKRAMIGVMRTGGISYHSSGDVAIAFSTANPVPHKPKAPIFNTKVLSDFYVDDLFEAASDACEEALLNSLLNAETIQGRAEHVAYQLPHDELRAFLQF